MTRGRGKKKPAKHKRDEKPKLDDDLHELACVIAEYQLDGGVRGWLKLPWRDGWNVVALAINIHRDIEGWKDPNPSFVNWLNARVLDRSLVKSNEDYFFAEEKMLEPSLAPIIRAAFRAFQISIGHNTSGDGSIFNAILIGPLEGLFSQVRYQGQEDDIAARMREHRCQDAIGTTIQMQGDVNDRLRRAFSTAWNRNLFLAAYSLPPAIKRPQ